eukprot:CAMPEP_0119275910 /NCGR_PEP_ID=MMETSP1329-20130426/14599_1 /TAXON_ID=114041 /ORGANISM="Genus nov. species nov., Strain RCC1024" /LENGTH=307 /DNA_ID=CAMNT_0007276331 /DNA_START=181 /DNA_END=1101 /DNA_ORIENTATION=+
MLGMGASINVNLFDEIRKAPIPILCGISSQYLFMPFVAWALANLFHLGDAESMALILLGMSPGGVTSTLFTYIAEANVTLSLVMTTCSTGLALVVMPFLLYVYVRPPLVSKGNDDAKVSFTTIIITLIAATLPALIGWRLRRAKPRAGEFVETWCTRFGALLLLATLGVTLGWPTKGGYGMTPSVLVCMVLMCPLGFLFGYGFAKLLGLDQVTARTVSLETGIQQVGIAASIAVQSFDGAVFVRTTSIMALFGAITVVFGALWSVLLRTACPLRDVEEKDPPPQAQWQRDGQIEVVQHPGSEESIPY